MEQEKQRIPGQPYANLTQRSEDWYEARKKCVLTGSDFGQALGIDNWKSRPELWKSKFDPNYKKREPTQFQLDMMKHGEVSEELAVEWIKEVMLEELKERNEGEWRIEETGLWLIENGKLKTGTSPDGLIYHGEDLVAVVEIKCPVKSELVVEKDDKAMLTNRSHYAQIQAHMLATKCNVGYYVVYDTKRKKVQVVKVPINWLFLQWMLVQTRRFCEAKTCPIFRKGEKEQRCQWVDQRIKELDNVYCCYSLEEVVEEMEISPQ